MICGNFETTKQGFAGEIRFFGRPREEVVLIAVESKDNEKAPDFRLHPADDARIDYGAAWKKISKEKRNYLSLKLNPVIGAPVYLRLFESETTPGTYELVCD